VSPTASKLAPPSADPYAIVEAVANALPEGYTVECIDGQILAVPRPKEPHLVAATNLGEELGPPFKRGRGGPGGWILLDEAECHLDQDSEYVVHDPGVATGFPTGPSRSASTATTFVHPIGPARCSPRARRTTTATA
jgi:hypothetical protein